MSLDESNKNLWSGKRRNFPSGEQRKIDVYHNRSQYHQQKKSCVYFTSEMFQLKVIACWQRYLRLSCDNLAIYFFSALSSWNCRVHFHSRSFRSVYISFPYQINFRPSLHNRFRYNFPSGGDGVVAKDTSEGN